MITRILKKDISRNKTVLITLFIFIMMAAALTASAVHMIVTLSGSMEQLFKRAELPDFVQMYSGELDQQEIDAFSESAPMVKDQQTVSMLGINGAYIWLGENSVSEAESIMENSFVKQNEQFDFLLDTDNEIIHLADGEIAVPVYHMQEYDLEIGDAVTVRDGTFQSTFTIAAFVRDAQMNPGIVTSKRFVVSDGDWERLGRQFHELEYLIEFRMKDRKDISEFETMYQESDLPGNDTMLTYSLYYLLNGLTDGIIAAVILLISVLTILISALCLRFTLITAMEEDYREIGAMKAVGVSAKDIRKVYLIKYNVLAAAAALCGYAAAFTVKDILTGNITLYMGQIQQTTGHYLFPFLGTCIVFSAVVLFCRIILRRFRKISAVQAVREGSIARTGGKKKKIHLYKSKMRNINVFLGAKAVFEQVRVYGILCFIFMICTFLMIVPNNFLNTIDSPEFISYMGAGRSDIRIDIQQGMEIEEQGIEISRLLENDAEVEDYAVMMTGIFQTPGEEGGYENLKVEVGDFTKFPLEYTQGKIPENEDEIALSAMLASELNKKAGDALTVITGSGETDLQICGIYQDVTNGGKTAKGLFSLEEEEILWSVVNIKTAEGVDPARKANELGKIDTNSKITVLDEYVSQTMGGLTGQLTIISHFAFAAAIIIVILIVFMFYQMLLAKEAKEIAVMQMLGITEKQLKIQYITRVLIVLTTGVVLGELAAGTIGENIAGMFISGVDSMSFTVNPWINFILCPLGMAAAALGSVIAGSRRIKKIDRMLIAE